MTDVQIWLDTSEGRLDTRDRLDAMSRARTGRIELDRPRDDSPVPAAFGPGASTPERPLRRPLAVAPALDRLPEPVLRGTRAALVPMLIVAVALCIAGGIAAAVWFGPSFAFAGLVAPAAVMAVGYRVASHRWLTNWGATPAEVRADLPGDDLVAPASSTTRAITVDAPVEQVWSWLVELAFGPGGWAGRSWIARDGARDGGLVPGLQRLATGDDATTLLGAGFEVHRVQAPDHIVSQAPDGTTWCLCVEDLGAGRSRLVSRFRTGPAAEHGAHGHPAVLADPAVFVVERRMLRGIRRRAEAGAPVGQLLGNLRAT